MMALIVGLPTQDLKSGPPECETGISTTWPWCWVHRLFRCVKCTYATTIYKLQVLI